MNQLGCALLASFLVSALAAQDLEITSFGGNGRLSWANGNTNLFYRVEWSPSVAGGGLWSSNFESLADIRVAGPTGTVAVPMFYRVVGTANRTVYPSSVPRTMAAKDSDYDDGYHSKGAAWPVPRFTVGTGTSSNCVTDNLTGLMWLRNPDGTRRGWWVALAYCENLDGSGGRGGYADWRMPNVRELFSLVDHRFVSPSLPNATGKGQCSSGDPFTEIKTNACYWSGTTYRENSNFTWGFSFQNGAMQALNKFDGAGLYCWPVRGGL